MTYTPLHVHAFRFSAWLNSARSFIMSQIEFWANEKKNTCLLSWVHTARSKWSVVQPLMIAHTILLINNNISIISTGFMCSRNIAKSIRTLTHERRDTRQQETGLQSTGTCLCVRKPKMSPHFIETHNAGATCATTGPDVCSGYC